MDSESLKYRVGDGGLKAHMLPSGAVMVRCRCSAEEFEGVIDMLRALGMSARFRTYDYPHLSEHAVVVEHPDDEPDRLKAYLDELVIWHEAMRYDP